MFSYIFRKYLRTPFLYKTPYVAASNFLAFPLLWETKKYPELNSLTPWCPLKGNT